MLKLNRRSFIKNTSLLAISSSFSQSLIMDAFANNPLNIYSINVAKVTKNWDEMSKMADVDLIPSPSFMDLYKLGNKPIKDHRALERLMDELGQHPYLAKQPNGWSDHSDDWMSPELLIRRLVSAKDSFELTKSKNNNFKFYKNIVHKNFDNPEKIFQYLDKAKRAYEIQILLFNHPDFLRA